MPWEDSMAYTFSDELTGQPKDSIFLIWKMRQKTPIYMTSLELQLLFVFTCYLAQVQHVPSHFLPVKTKPALAIKTAAREGMRKRETDHSFSLFNKI